jgi:putative ABC transport system ATP-binding protein
MLELKKIDKYYNPGTVNEMCLFDGFDLTVADGEFVSVVGSNGSGKTMLMKCICGFVPVTQGSVMAERS